MSKRIVHILEMIDVNQCKREYLPCLLPFRETLVHFLVEGSTIWESSQAVGSCFRIAGDFASPDPETDRDSNGQ